MIDDVFEKVREEGREKAKLEIAKKLLNLGYSIEKVSDLIELSIEEIKENNCKE